MLVTDPADRCLLARNRAWPERRVSILAGFVDPGSRRACRHARGARGDRHHGRPGDLSRQPAVANAAEPDARFHALAEGGQRIQVDADEIGEAHWYSRDELLAALTGRQLALPPPISIARQIIEAWYGGELPDGATSNSRRLKFLD